MKERLVVIGNGMAGMRTVEELLRLDRNRYEISVFGAEPHVNYNRILLSPVLAGEQTLDDIILNDRKWYDDNRIKLYTGNPVVTIDRHRRQVIAADGMRLPYDRLLLATGSKPFVIPVPGRDLRGVVTFRDIGDVKTMLDASKKYKRAAVIGGGLLGLEAANGLMKRGMDVSVIHLGDNLMDRQLDASAAKLLRQNLLARGLKFHMGVQTEAILGRRRAKGIKFSDGSEIKADLVVMAAGIRPNIDLAKAANLYCERGIVVHDTMQTFDPRIYAVGECVEHRKATYGLVAPIWEQAKVCANHLAQHAISRYAGSVTATQLKVTGIAVYSAGDYQGDESTDEIVFADPRHGVYKRLVTKDQRLVGTVLYGDTVDGPWYFDLIQRGESIGHMRDQLIFGRDACAEVSTNTNGPLAEKNSERLAREHGEKEGLDATHAERAGAAFKNVAPTGVRIPAFDESAVPSPPNALNG